MSRDWARRELLVTLTATPATGPEQRLGPERRLLAEAGILDRETGRWDAHLGSLDEDSLRRLQVFLRAAEEHGTALSLGVTIAPNHWRGPTVPWPAEPSGVLTVTGPDPGGIHTLLLIDVQFLDGGPTHHWWVAAEPPTGTHPDPDAACRVLRDLAGEEDPFAPFTGVSLGVWGGPGRASVRGFWRGRWVQAQFDRADSGETNRWDRLGAVLQPTSTVPPV